MKLLDRDGREIVEGSRVIVNGPGFSNRHRGEVLASDGVNVKVRIDGLLGNPYFFTASFDGVIEDLLLANPSEEAGK